MRIGPARWPRLPVPGRYQTALRPVCLTVRFEGFQNPPDATPHLPFTHHTSTARCRSWTWVCATPDLQHGLGESPNMDMEDKKQTSLSMSMPWSQNLLLLLARPHVQAVVNCLQDYAVLCPALAWLGMARDAEAHSTFICKAPSNMSMCDHGPRPFRCGLACRPFWDRKPPDTPFSVGRAT